ncbi:hypothetical protein [Kitasatospora sp. NBC_01539]|uniref:hypothetical protein n=1 Tax=Kitasatospora sp. NBC_01539 TaxID=2903577 RepID=UPI0038601034
MRGRAGAVALLVLLAAGCGSTAGGGGAPSAAVQAAARERAAAVARAWPGSPQEQVWRTGYAPLDVPPEWLPADAFHDDADKQAYAAGRLVLTGGLPRTFSGRAQVRWADGAELSLPLRSADAVFRGLVAAGKPCGGDCGRPLEVTGAQPGTREVATSRGRAEIPVWEFAVAGYAAPFVYPAVEGQLPPPDVPRAPQDLEGVLGAAGPAVSADGRTLTASVGHGSCERPERAEAYETDAAVVLIALARPTAGPGTACDAALRMSPVDFRLERPLGDRVVLDLWTGAPELPREGLGGPSQGGTGGR